jgi:proline iminopeptidase
MASLREGTGMRQLWPEIEPYETGRLEVGDGHRIYWEACGARGGKPAVVLHGGPGSGCAPSWRGLFNPRAYRMMSDSAGLRL